MAKTEAEFSQLCARLGWSPGVEAFDRLDVLVELWLRYAPSLNITGAKDRAGVLAQVADGLETVVCARRAHGLDDAEGLPGGWVDVGSGGGFPGLVVAACTHVPVLLVEPRARRAAFLELALQTIKRDSTGVIRARLGDATWNKELLGGVYRRYGVIVATLSARAVLRPAEWLESGRNVAGEGGIVLVHASPATAELGEPPLVSVDGNFGPILAFSKKQRDAHDDK